MLFSRKHQLTLPDTDLYVGDTRALARVDHYKYLGLNCRPLMVPPYWLSMQKNKQTRMLLGMLCRNFLSIFQLTHPCETV